MILKRWVGSKSNRSLGWVPGAITSRIVASMVSRGAAWSGHSSMKCFDDSEGWPQLHAHVSDILYLKRWQFREGLSRRKRVCSILA